ncbi:MAG TPA: dihydrofolate reductase [Rhizomicrobium sp.]|jgi:dihydrofolate reductase|nr:dihydrofolate reductase [Rhizomicrobium sp.]
MITLVLAMARNGVIGKDGAIPWRIADDLKRFKQLTLRKPVIMGRKTWDSLPRKPLPGRDNIVVTRQPGWSAEGAIAARSLDEALSQVGDASVIGGGEVYREALARADRIELTEVHRDFEGDALFTFDRAVWREIAREDHTAPDGLAYSYVTLVRA